MESLRSQSVMTEKRWLIESGAWHSRSTPFHQSSRIRHQPWQERDIDSGQALGEMTPDRYTECFENAVLRKRPYLKNAWCEYAIENSEKDEPQEHNRHRFWARIPELRNRYLRVVTLKDKITIQNPLPDRSDKP